MALARCNFVIQNENGDIIDGATVEVRRESDNGLESVYSDRDGLSSLGNPYIAADGANPGFYAAGGAYKITVTHASIGSRVIRHEPVGLQQEEDAVSASEVSYIHADSPADITNVQQALDDIYANGGGAPSSDGVFRPEDYGAVGDNVTNDTTAFQSMTTAVVAAGGGTIEFGNNKNYLIGLTPSAGGTSVLMNLSGCDGLRINFQGSKLNFNATFSGGRVVRVIQLQNCEDVEINGFNCEQTVTTTADALNGLVGIYAIDTNRDIRVNGFYQKYGRSCFECIRSSELSLANRTRGLDFNGLIADQVFYGFTLQKNGDDAHIDCKGINNARIFDAYNVRQIDARIESIPGANTLQDVLLGIYTNHAEAAISNTLSDIRIEYISRSQTDSCDGFVGLFIQQGTGTTAAGHVRNIDLKLDIEIESAALTSTAFKLFKQTNAAAADTTARGHVLENLCLHGSLKSFANNVNPIEIGQFGTWSGDTVRNIEFGPLTSTGSGTGDFAIDSTGFGNTQFHQINFAHDLNWTNDSGFIFFDYDVLFTNNASFTQLGGKGVSGSKRVVGPTASVTDSRPALFDGTTGGRLKEHTAALGTAAAKNTGTTGDAVPLLNTMVAFSGTGTTSITTTGATPLQIVATDAGAFGGFFECYHNSASPASGDRFMDWKGAANSDAGTKRSAFEWYGIWDDATNGSEDSQLQVYMMNAGAQVMQFGLALGCIIGASPTGGYKGAGTLNASAVYDDNTLLTDIVQEWAETGTVDLDRWDAMVPDHVIAKARKTLEPVMERVPVKREKLVPIEGGYRKEIISRVEERPLKIWTPIYDENGNGIDAVEEEQFDTVDLPEERKPREHYGARIFKKLLDDGLDPKDPASFAAYIKANKALPGLPTEAEWEQGKFSLGEMHTRSTLALEILTQAFVSLSERVSVLEKEKEK